ncbi:protein Wnt-4 [Zerene cesonia]|uniref:protein Wnt-4 n=1 Tax=Zerene cesonia TaxID=33412 RepID=UPI0018E4FDAE|nr:protein Wnt-4 [Zerene cesonia]
MLTSSVITVVVYFTVSSFALQNVQGTKPVLQKTVEALFMDRSETIYPGTCEVFISSTKQSKICKREPSLPKVLQTAKKQAINACIETFQYDRWNCSLVFNRKANKSIFNKIYRETAFVHALIAASITHAVAKGCASGDITRCSCIGSFKNTSWQIKGCGDDFKYGKKLTKNFLDLKHAGNDQIGEILKQDVHIGMDAIGEQLKEVCKCHGFSGSCTTKTCWKKLAPFNSAMGLLKKHYHHAIKKKLVNYTTKRAIAPKARRRMEKDRKSLLYLQKTPNLCVSTKSRACKDRNNCATLCCGRGFVVIKSFVRSRCRCKMVDCCVVKCDTCVEEVENFTCK